MATINPYLTFNGNCEEAFNLYKSVFGGEFAFSGRFKDMPENPEYPVEESEKDLIMHISLPIGNGTVLMGSDTSRAFGKLAEPGSNFSVSINTDSVEEATRMYNALADGGTEIMPLNKTFWGAYFGQLVDRFGIRWMVNCELAEHKEFEERNKPT